MTCEVLMDFYEEDGGVADDSRGREKGQISATTSAVLTTYEDPFNLNS